MTWCTIEELSRLSEVERLFWLTVLEPLARVVQGEAYLNWDARTGSQHRDKIRLRCNGCGRFTAGRVRNPEFGVTSAVECLACGRAICLAGQVAPFRVRIWVALEDPPQEEIVKKAPVGLEALIAKALVAPPPQPRPNVFAPPAEEPQLRVVARNGAPGVLEKVTPVREPKQKKPVRRFSSSFGGGNDDGANRGG